MRSLFALVLVACVAADPAIAAKPMHSNWTNPRIAAYPVGTIALLPIATYDYDADTEWYMSLEIPRVLAPKGYEWVDSLAVARAIADTLTAKQVRSEILSSKRAQVDAGTAAAVCRRTGADAVLAVRVENAEHGGGDLWIKSALVTRDGTLLWTLDRSAGSRIVQNPDRSAQTTADLVASRAPVPGLLPILRHWALEFPPRKR